MGSAPWGVSIRACTTTLPSSAERLAVCSIDAVDAVVCNSAIWQTDVKTTVHAVGQVLRPDGRLVFNIGAEMLADYADAGQSADPLLELMKSFAAREYGWVASPSRRHGLGRQELSEQWLRHVMVNAGLRVDEVRIFAYPVSLEEQHAWLSIPVFTLRPFGSLSYGQRMTALEYAYQRLADGRDSREPQGTSRWVGFAATCEHP